MALNKIFLGTAGWNIARTNKKYFHGRGSHLERYASTFSCVEINSSFKKTHKAITYARWAKMVPDSFRFSVKLPADLTHKAKLRVSAEGIKSVVTPMLELGERLGTFLVQLPPKLEFDAGVAEEFFANLREITYLPIVCEPRHVSWLSPEALHLFRAYNLTKVNADPEPCMDPEERFARSGAVSYFRLHGNPEVYRSAYSKGFLQVLLVKVEENAARRPVWVIFDNTALGHATPDAFYLQELTEAFERAG